MRILLPFGNHATIRRQPANRSGEARWRVDVDDGPVFEVVARPGLLDVADERQAVVAVREAVFEDLIFRPPDPDDPPGARRLIYLAPWHLPTKVH